MDGRAESLIPEGAVDPKYIEESMDTPDTGSFMHLHLGIDGKGLDDLDIHYSVSREEGGVWRDVAWCGRPGLSALTVLAVPYAWSSA